MKTEAASNDASRDFTGHGMRQSIILKDGIPCDKNMPEVYTMHWHDAIEFIVMTQGESRFYIEDHEFIAHENDVVFVRKKQIHMRDSTLNNCSFFSLVVDETFLGIPSLDNLLVKFIMPIFNNTISVQAFFSGENDYIVELLGKIHAALEKKDFCYELLIRAYLYEIFFGIYNNHNYMVTGVKKESPAIKAIKQITEYINENFMKDITVEDLSKMSNFSKDHLIRTFYKCAGKTPITYINYIRINKAAQLLIDQNLSVSEVAASVGFNNFSYFSKLFKRQLGYSPSEYRSRSSSQFPGII